MTPERWQQVMQVLDPAVALDTADRATYLDRTCAGDTELRREVESLIQSHEQAHSKFLDSPVSLQPPPGTTSRPARLGRRIGAYDILEQAGKGGMGEVYRAIRADGQFTKEVALKLVRGGLDTAFILERFRNERQILAGLDHPNIARLLDGGTSDDGIPYLVMEFVSGVPIDAYCDSHHLNISQRLGLFRQVCAAVEYAHQRLVIHRDLKPGNILVSNDGTPKLLDFGIAKILNTTGAQEATIVQAMTPEYASPEQVRGEPITTASDVYSLGVVLYQLLTGRSPYSTEAKTPHELSRAITDTDPQRPSSVVRLTQQVRIKGEVNQLPPEQVSSVREATPAKLQRLLAGDLDNILMKVLRKEPERRYRSVEQFDEDLRRHLDGLPVTAGSDSWTYRAWKFIHRHTIAVAAAALALIALLAGVGLVLRADRTARAERARAEQRFNDLRKLSNSLIFEVHDAIQDLPGSTPARKLLLDRAVEYLDTLAKDSGGDPDLQRELAWGYQRLAVVQGSTTESNVGDTTASNASQLKMTGLFESVAKANPNNVIDQLNVAMAHRLLSFGSELEPSGRHNLEEAMAITDRLMKTNGTNPKVRSERALEYQNLGIIQNETGDRAQALESARKFQAMRMDLQKTNPDYPHIQRSVAMSTVRLGEQLSVMGQRPEALHQMARGIEIYEAIAKSDSNPDVKRELAVSRSKLGQIQLMEGEWKAASESFRFSRDTIAPLAKGDPENTMLQSDLAGADYTEGQTLLLSGNGAEALAKLRDAARKAETMGSAAAVSPGQAYLWLGDAQMNAHDLNGALQSYKKASALLQLKPEEPASDDARCESATSYNRLGAAMLKMHDLKQADVAYQKAADIAAPLILPEHQDVPAYYVAADAYAGLGEVYEDEAQEARGQSSLWNEARAAYQKSLSLWQEIPNPSRISPTGFIAGDPREVSRRLNRLDAVMAQTGKPKG